MGKKILLALSIYVVGLLSGIIVIVSLPNVAFMHVALPFILFGSGFALGYVAKSYWKKRHAKEKKPPVQEADDVKVPDYLPEDF
jgi:hypothetical protein